MAAYYDLSKLQVGDVLFSFHKHNLFSKLIWLMSKWRTKKYKKEPKISHAMLYIGDELIVESTFSGTRIKNQRAIRKKSYSLKMKRCTELTDEKREALKIDASREVGHGHYAFKQLFVMIFRKLLRLKSRGDVDKDATQCSEFVVSLYRKIGIDLVPGIYASDCSPLDIFNSDKLIDIITN